MIIRSSLKVYKGIHASVWLAVSAAVTAEFPQGHNEPFSFSAQKPANFREIFGEFLTERSNSKKPHTEALRHRGHGKKVD
jgi:hypothetical protein